MNLERVEVELRRLEAGQRAGLAICSDGRQAVIYHSVPTGGEAFNLPAEVDVIVPIPSAYPANFIDLAGLPTQSPLLPRLQGGSNPQGVLIVNGCSYTLGSYHPYQGTWNPQIHGFHTYYDHILSWLGYIK